jgi:hypothetical protein
VPAQSITAEALAKEHQADPKTADALYRGKRLLISGQLEDVEPFPTGLVVHIAGLPSDPAKMFPGRSLRCDFVAAASSKIAGLAKGQRLTFTGKCDGDHGGFVDLLECELLEVGPDPTVRVTAAQLTRDFLTDENTADGRYKDRAVLVEGTVVGLKEDGGGQRLLLEGHNEPSPVAVRVLVACAAQDREQLASLKKGDKVRIRGQCAGLFLGEVVIQGSRRVK